MIRIASEKDFLSSFRPIDRDHVELPDGLKFPLVLRDYVSWCDPAGHRTFVVFTLPGNASPYGIVFRKDQSGGPAPARICEWCHASGSSDEISLLTATASSNRRVGVNLCSDLSCKAKIEKALTRNVKLETAKVLERIGHFARKNIF